MVGTRATISHAEQSSCFSSDWRLGHAVAPSKRTAEHAQRRIAFSRTCCHLLPAWLVLGRQVRSPRFDSRYTDPFISLISIVFVNATSSQLLHEKARLLSADLGRSLSAIILADEVVSLALSVLCAIVLAHAASQLTQADGARSSMLSEWERRLAQHMCWPRSAYYC